MARGKYLSLDEARNAEKLDQFAKEHPATGDADKFDDLFRAMAPPPENQRKRKKRTPPK